MKIRYYTFLLLALAFLGFSPNMNAQGNCQQDSIPPVAVCLNGLLVDLPSSGVATIWGQDINVQSWDNCTLPGELDFRLTTDQNATTPPTTASLDFTAPGTYTVAMWVGDEAGNWNQCWTFITVQSVSYVAVRVYQDEDTDCTQSTGENGLPNWPVQVSNEEFGFEIYYTDDDGNLNIPIYETGPGSNPDFNIEILLGNGVSSGCQTLYTISPPFADDLSFDFGVQLATACNALSVDISTFRLRPCMASFYNVTYCNYSAFTVEDGEVTVTLDPGISLESASIPYTDLGGNSFSFAVGDLESATCGTFKLDVMVSCDAEVGVTKCARAEIQPYDCDDPSNSYSGASLIVTGECDEGTGSVQFQIQNVGDGNMLEPLSYVVVEDVVMYMEAPVQLESQQSVFLPTVPANGATWRLTIPQPDGHPGLDAPTVFIEGCGGLNPGQVNQFTLNDRNPNVSIDCQVITGSYDPNDKQAFPTGYGEDNIIEPGTEIEYLIRFQNTGTDTAFNVVIRDQLDPLLDYTSVRSGASSHPYRMVQEEAGNLAFYFDDIMLPDSNISEVNSHGFIKFRVAQTADNALGSVIENEAAIYFDFNEPIITNTVFHTLGERFITANRPEPTLPGVELAIAPNPFKDQANFKLEGHEALKGNFILYDQWGRMLREQTFVGNEFQFNRQNLSSGLYFYMVYDQGMLLARGRLVVQ